MFIAASFAKSFPTSKISRDNWNPRDRDWETVVTKESMWAFPREVSAKEKMRQCYEDITNNSGIASESAAYAEELKERFSKEKLYAKFVENVVSLEEIEQMQKDVDDLLSDLL